MTDIAPPDIGMDSYQRHFGYNGLSFLPHLDSMKTTLDGVYDALHNHETNQVTIQYQDVAEELGTILQGISAISAKMGIPLSDLARANIYQYEQTRTETEDDNDQH